MAKQKIEIELPETLLTEWKPEDLGLDLLANASQGKDAIAQTIEETVRLFNSQCDLFSTEKDKYENATPTTDEDEQIERIISKHEQALIDDVPEPMQKAFKEHLSWIMTEMQGAPSQSVFIRNLLRNLLAVAEELAEDVVYYSAEKELPKTKASKSDAFDSLEKARATIAEIRESLDQAISLAQAYKVNLPKNVKFSEQKGKGNSVRKVLDVKRVPQLPGQRKKNRTSAPSPSIFSGVMQFSIDGDDIPTGTSLERIANIYLSTVENPVLASDLLNAMKGKTLPHDFTINGHKVKVVKK